MPPSVVDQQRAVALLSDLIRIDSVNPALEGATHGEKPLAEFVADYCRRLGLEVSFQEVEPGRPNVLARLRGGGGAIGEWMQFRRLGVGELRGASRHHYKEGGADSGVTCQGQGHEAKFLASTLQKVLSTCTLARLKSRRKEVADR